MKTQNKVRVTALLTGGVLAISSLHATSAQAKTSRRNYKTGAAVLGVLGVILAAKGKTVPAIIVGAGAYYAYKKGQETHDDVYPTNRNRQARNTSKRNSSKRNSSKRNSSKRNDQRDNNAYPDATYNDNSDNASYDNASYDNANYDNANYDSNAADDRYAQNTDGSSVYPDALTSRKTVAAKVAPVATRDANSDHSDCSENDVSID